MRKSRSTSLVFEVFHLLMNYADALVSAPSQTYKVSMSGEASRYRKMHFDERQRRALAQLRRKRWIDYEFTNGAFTFSFTEKGLHEGLVSRIITTTKKLSRGYVCIVAYDVPEDFRQGRRVLESLFRKAKCIRLQKSVWMTGRDIVDDLEATIRLHRIESMVTIVVGKKIV